MMLRASLLLLAAFGAVTRGETIQCTYDLISEDHQEQVSAHQRSHSSQRSAHALAPGH